MNKNQIFKIYGTDYLQMTKEILEESGLADMIENKDRQIGIKPNLVSPSEASWGGTTHPEVVAGIRELLCWKVPGWEIRRRKLYRYVDMIN